MSLDNPSLESSIRLQRSALAVAGAYAWWGITPIYFRTLVGVDTYEIIAHRILWTVFCLALLKQLGLGASTFRHHLKSPKLLAPFAFSSVCILVNWLVFTWAVTNNHVLDTSLGYFINPLISVLLGVVLLGERLRPLQLAAVALAAVGVSQWVIRHGVIPWIALVLAITFAFYGLLRKQSKIDAVNGLSLELIFGLPVALLYLMIQWRNPAAPMHGYQTFTLFMLLLAGPVTMTPLLLFGSGAPQLNLATIGILQYIAPTLSFLLAVFVYHEPFEQAKLIAFVCIWAGLLLYTTDSLRASRRRLALEQAAVPLD